jgi:hypothetical protein
MTLDEIQIDPEFEALLGTLSADERQTLKEEIIAEGRIREKLIVWRGRSILIDGHNRLAIYRELLAEGHIIEEPGIEELGFPDRADVLQWMYRNQAARRNWSDIQRSVVRAKAYKAEKQKPETQARTEEGAFSSSSTPWSHNGTTATKPAAAKRTATKVGTDMGGVSANTVLRDEALDNAMEAIKAVNGKAYADILNKTLKIPKKEIIALGSSKDIGKGIANLRAHGNWKGNGKPAEKPAATDIPPEKTLLDHADKAYTTLLTHIEKAKHLMPGHPGIFNKLNTAMKDVFDGIQKLKKLVS